MLIMINYVEWIMQSNFTKIKTQERGRHGDRCDADEAANYLTVTIDKAISLRDTSPEQSGFYIFGRPINNGKLVGPSRLLK